MAALGAWPSRPQLVKTGVQDYLGLLGLLGLVAAAEFFEGGFERLFGEG
jgi:hypothetical protein